MSKNTLLVFLIVLLLFTAASALSKDIETVKFNSSFQSLNRILGVDLKKLLRELYEKENPNSVRQKLKEIEFRHLPVNFSHDQGNKVDYLIQAHLRTDWEKIDTNIVLVFIKAGNKYELKFKWVGWNKSFESNPKLIDIDSDNKMEILLEADFSGNQSTASFVNIWKFLEGEFRIVFDEGIVEGYGLFPYSYANTYKFAKNKDNSKLLDIVFTIHTDIDEHQVSNYKKNSIKFDFDLPKPFHDNVLYQFNGKEYVPNKEVYDYRKYIRLYLKD